MAERLLQTEVVEVVEQTVFAWQCPQCGTWPQIYGYAGRTYLECPQCKCGIGREISGSHVSEWRRIQEGPQ